MQLNDNEIILLSELLIKVLRHDIEEKNKIVHVSTQTIGSDQVFLFNHTLTVYNTINLTSTTYNVVLPSTNSVRHVLHYINKIV